MSKDRQDRRRSLRSAASLEAELERTAAMKVEGLRSLWRERRGRFPPDAFSKDLIARALAYWLQEERLGGMDRRVGKLLASQAKNGIKVLRYLKIGSVIVRDYQGETHEVLVVPGGFCWRGQTYSSLSTVAKAITGTNWNGPRFFGLRGAEVATASAERAVLRSDGSKIEASKPKREGGSIRTPARRTALIVAAAISAVETAGRGGGL